MAIPAGHWRPRGYRRDRASRRQPHSGDHHSRHTYGGRPLAHLWRERVGIPAGRGPRDGCVSPRPRRSDQRRDRKRRCARPEPGDGHAGRARWLELGRVPRSLRTFPAAGHGDRARRRSRRAYGSNRGTGCTRPGRSTAASTGQRVDHHRPYPRRPDRCAPQHSRHSAARRRRVHRRQPACQSPRRPRGPPVHRRHPRQPVPIREFAHQRPPRMEYGRFRDLPAPGMVARRARE